MSRITYTSKAGIYRLNPTQIFEIVDALEKYMVGAANKVAQDNPGLDPAIVNFRGIGRVLSIFTQYYDGDRRKPLDLATLILCDKELMMFVNPQSNVAIPSKELHKIGREYCLE
jgi:hypothetical protein